MDGTTTPVNVPLSPLAHPVPATVYVPLSELADPVNVAVMTWEAMFAEVIVAVCPVMLPLMGTAVVAAMHATQIKMMSLNSS